MTRKIIHIDMDCFYAAVEMRSHPELRDVPMAVGGTVEERGVLSTCNYLARKFGLHSAMSTFQAFKLCPQLKLVRPNHESYKEESAEIFKIFHRYTNRVEGLSLDEAFLDVTGSDVQNGSASLIAKEIREAIFEERGGITASAGIAPNKFLAKVASDWNKPNGQFTISPEDVEAFTRDLPLEKIPGVGKACKKKLDALGLSLCKDILPLSKETLAKHFGSFGETLYAFSRGIDDRPVVTDRIRKSISTECTFPKDVRGIEDCERELRAVYFEFLKRARRFVERESQRTFPEFHCFVKIKYADFKTTTIERNFADVSWKRFSALFRERYDTSKKVRLLGAGVRLNDSDAEDGLQTNLF